jgi:hypothetical protein
MASRNRESKTEAKPIIHTHRFYPKIHTIELIQIHNRKPQKIK